jgi:hypothetical protein
VKLFILNGELDMDAVRVVEIVCHARVVARTEVDGKSEAMLLRQQSA